MPDAVGHDSEPAVIPRLPILRRTLAYFLPDRGPIGLLVGLIGLSTLLGLMQVWPLALLVDSVLHQKHAIDSGSSLLWLPDQSRGGNRSPGPVCPGAADWTGIAVHISRHACHANQSPRHVAGALRLFRKLQSLNVLYHRSKPQADSIYRLSTDAGSCQALLNVGIDVAVAAVTLMVMLAVMSSRSPWLTGISLAVVPLIVLTNLGFTKVLQTYTLSAKETDSQFLVQVQRAVATFPLISAFNREALELSRFQQSAQSNLTRRYRLHWKFSLYRLCIGLIFGLGER